jgi:hypothetical protein
MSFVFKPSDIKKLGRVFGTEPKLKGSNYRFEIAPADPLRKLVLEIYPDLPIGNEKGNLISVYTLNTHLQLHFCSGYVVSEMLGEVTFVGEHDGKLSGLILEKEGGCSVYANVNRSLLSGDFTQLGPEVMLSGIALSLTDGILKQPAVSGKPRRTSHRRKAARR